MKLSQEPTDTSADAANVQSMLDSSPHAALWARFSDAEGFVIDASNEKGRGVEALIAHGALPQIPDLVAASAVKRSFVHDTVILKGGTAEVALEISALPYGGANAVLVLCRDLTTERNLRTALIDSRQRYKDLVEVSSDFSWEVRADEMFVFVSPRGALGYNADELVGTHPELYVVNPQDFSPLPFVSDRPMENIELWMRKADGSSASVIVSCLPLFDKSETWRGARGICRDVTGDRANEAALLQARNREQLLNYIVAAIRDELNPADMLIAAAKATGRALGTIGCCIYRLDEGGQFTRAAEFGNFMELPTDVKSELDVEGAVVERLGSTCRLLISATRYRKTANGLLCLYKNLDDDWTADDHLLIRDVANQLGIATEQVIAHERIVKLSRTDGMTGLLNRRAFFEEELPRRIKRLERSGETAALFYVDMDNFKLVNDVHGHQVGDEAILDLRNLLEEHSRPGDVLGRLGGDEFAMWLDGMPEGTAVGRAEHLLTDSKRLERLSGDPERPLGLSVGIAMFDPTSGEDLDDLISRADAAMYAVKRAGKGGYHVAEIAEGSVAEDREDAEEGEA